MRLHYYPLINKFFAPFRNRGAANGALAQLNEDLLTKPFVTIAREPGSGGAPIAKAVADKLGFTFVNEQIIEEIALSTKKRAAVIKEIDEKSRSKIDDMVHSWFNEEYVDDLKYVTELVRVILTYAYKGHVVILGRGANFITPFAKGLHVNITAPYDVRVQRAMDFEGVDLAQAKEVIAQTEKERRDFVKQYFDKNISKCNSYDLTLNTQFFGVNSACDIIIEAFYKKFSRTARYGAIFR
jgi:cytidylate kinase